MARIVEEFTDLAVTSGDSGVPFVAQYPPAAGANRIVLAVYNVVDLNVGTNLQNVTVTKDDLSPVDGLLTFTSGTHQGLVVAAVSVPDGSTDNVNLLVTIGLPEAPLAVYLRGQYFTLADTLQSDADLAFSYAENGTSDNPMYLTLTPQSTGDLTVALTTWYFDTATETPTWAPEAFQTGAQVAYTIEGEPGMGGAVHNNGVQLTGVSSRTGAQVLSVAGPGGDYVTGWLLGFVIRDVPGGGGATGFNCECEDPTPSKTLAAYRRDMLVRLGYAAVVNNPPPGMADFCDTLLRDAQNQLYLEYPALRTRRFFRWSLEQGTRFYGIRDNDEGGIRATVTISVASPGVVTWPAAPQNGRRVSFFVAEGGSLPAPLEVGTEYFVINRTGTTCQLALTPGGTAINTTAAGSGTITAHGFPSPGCVFNLEPYHEIEGVWIVLPNNIWLPMSCGIPPEWYTTVLNAGIPSRYEIRQCIEIFPPPASSQYKLYVKGHFGLRPFDIDSDKPTIDGDLVYLWALANAKAHYQQPDAGTVGKQAQRRLENLTSGTHLTRRYVPGTKTPPPAVMPVFLPLNGAAP